MTQQRGWPGFLVLASLLLAVCIDAGPEDGESQPRPAPSASDDIVEQCREIARLASDAEAVERQLVRQMNRLSLNEGRDARLLEEAAGVISHLLDDLDQAMASVEEEMAADVVEGGLLLSQTLNTELIVLRRLARLYRLSDRGVIDDTAGGSVPLEGGVANIPDAKDLSLAGLARDFPNVHDFPDYDVIDEGVFIHRFETMISLPGGFSLEAYFEELRNERPSMTAEAISKNCRM